MRAHERLNVEFEFPHNGWLPMRLSFLRQEMFLPLSRVLYAPLDGLVRALGDLLVQGAGFAECFLEPDELVFCFNRFGFSVRENAGLFTGEGPILFQAPLPPETVVRRFMLALEALERQARLRPEAWAEHWGGFPDLQRLRALQRRK